MKALLCIDDTDDLESPGTGEILQNLCAALEERGLAKGGFVSRHQLLLHDDIAYTSHNSSMCTELTLSRENFRHMIELSREYLENNCAEGADPGLCVVDLEALKDIEILLQFGAKAKEVVLDKADAVAVADKYPETIFLSEHGGTGDGIIGALAGCGLRISGTDGRVKGKLELTPDELTTVGQFCEKYGITAVLDQNHRIVSGEDTLRLVSIVKPLVWNNQTAVLVRSDEKKMADWRLLSKQEVSL